MYKRYPVNSPTCKLAYANSPTPTGELAYVGELVITVIGEFVVHSCLRCVVKCVCSANLKIPVSSQNFCVKMGNWVSCGVVSVIVAVIIRANN